MADEQKLRQLESMLGEKVEEGSRHYENFIAVQQKY